MTVKIHKSRAVDTSFQKSRDDGSFFMLKFGNACMRGRVKKNADGQIDA